MKHLSILLLSLAITACSSENTGPSEPSHCSEGNVVNFDTERQGYSFLVENCFGMTYFSTNYGQYKTDWIAAYGMDFRYWTETWQYPRSFMEESDEMGKHYYQMIPSGSWGGWVSITTNYYDGSEYTDYYSPRSEEYNHYQVMTDKELHEERFNIALKHAVINEI